MSNVYTKQNVSVIIVVALFAIIISTTVSENAKAQMSSSNVTGSSSQNQTNMMGANLTGSIALGPTIAKAIVSQVHVSLANASTTAEKGVGANAHAAAVRIEVVHGFLVYMALVVDSNNNFHGVLVDAGNGKVLASTQMSMAAMEQSGMGINLMGPGMMQHGMMQGPGMMRSYP
jgi:uncharacterized membrane protein YkoI